MITVANKNRMGLKGTLPAGKWVALTVIFFAACILAMSCLVYVIDPFMYYRTPKKYSYYDARYCLAGLLKNEQYDSVIVGSSMMQNTNPAVLDGAGWKAIKATYGGACPADIYMLANCSLKSGKPKRFVIGIDSFTFSHTPDYIMASIPTYLYDSDFWNDGKYWINNKVWLSVFPNMLMNELRGRAQQALDLNAIDDWASNFTFGREEAYNSVKSTDFDASPSPSCLDQMKATYKATVYKLASEYSDKEFFLLYPPYSVLAWYGSVNSVKLCDDIAFKEYIMETKPPNVRIYDFQDIAEIITNLDNYKDYTHYSPEINDYMMKCLLTGENEVKTMEDQKAKNSRQMSVVGAWTFGN